MMSKRILIFNVNWLGDVLFSTATIRNIRYNFPGSFLACVIPKRCEAILKDNPHLDELIIFDEKGVHKNILAALRFIRELKNKRFDTVFLLHRSMSRALICRLSGIPQRIGYYTKKRGFLLTKKIIPPPRDSLHRIDYYLNLIEKAGLDCIDRYPEFFISEEDQRFIYDFLNKNAIDKDEILVGINPGGNWALKRWPEEYWAKLLDMLIDELGYKVIITGSAKDINLSQQIQALMKAKPISLAGILNLKRFGALCKRLDLFITADSGPLHIANAMGTKRIIALFGPTSPKVTGPYPEKNIIILQKNVLCQIPCYVVNCKDNRCMKAITPDEVVEKIKMA